MDTLLQAQLIEKEQIPQLSFKNREHVEQPNNLMSKLIEATRLGNLHRGKSRIVFHDDDGVKSVETTIWATGSSYIVLKGGIWLPISRIIDLHII